MTASAGSVGATRGVGTVAPTHRLDPAAFARLYQEHWRLLWCGAVAVVGDRTLAQDIVQQAAVVGLERLQTFDPSTSFQAWMIQIVRNIAMNESRKRTRRRTGAADTATLDSGPARPVSDPASSVLTGTGQVARGTEPFDDDLQRALNGLDETARGCLLLRVVLDMSYRDIALALSVPEGTAASHVHRARASLRRALAPLHAGGVP
jgi:RNA polymerase sigma-70 factor (ECF subfamily)